MLILFMYNKKLKNSIRWSLCFKIAIPPILQVFNDFFKKLGDNNKWKGGEMWTLWRI